MSEAMKARPIRMTDAEWEKCKALGGADWVRRAIARANVGKESARVAAKEAKLEEDKRRYLYTHAMPDGRVFYVGLGTKSRSRFFFSRSPDHTRMLKEAGKDRIVVTLIELTPGVSPYWQERQLIDRLRAEGHPLCNRAP